MMKEQAGIAPLTVKSEEAFLGDELHAHRAGTYELLGRLLVREPDAELLALLQGIGTVDTADGPVAMGWELLKQAAVQAAQADHAALKGEYFDLFVGVGRGELVPFGSWYLTGFLMEKPVAALRSDLRRLGIERQEGVVESEDHIAALCDVMAILIRSGDEDAWQAQQEFFDTHLAPWAERFMDDLQAAAGARFYRSVGFFGQSFLAFEHRLLAMHT